MMRFQFVFYFIGLNWTNLELKMKKRSQTTFELLWPIYEVSTTNVILNCKNERSNPNSYITQNQHMRLNCGLVS